MKRKSHHMIHNIIILTLLVSVILLTIGYAYPSRDLTFNGADIDVRTKKDIRITELTSVSHNSSATSELNDYAVSAILSNVNLPNASSTVTYVFKVTNIGNMEACISAVNNLPSNLTYTLNNYTLRDVMCDDNNSNQCSLGSVTTVSLTIGYDTNGFDSNNTEYNLDIDLTFSYMVDAVAKIGHVYYDTLQEAINDAPTDDTLTTIVLLKSTSENVETEAGQNILLDFNGKTLSNNGNFNVIKNYAQLELTNGTITTDAETNGAVNCYPGGEVVANGIQIIVNGGRQAIWNDGGSVIIEGSTYLRSNTGERAVVQNQKNGTMLITGGSMVSNGLYAVNNAGTLTIGVKDGVVHQDYPLMQSVDIGIYSTTNFNFYDGIVKSQANPFYNTGRIADTETNYGVLYGTEIINGATYNTAYLGISRTVTFNANRGSLYGDNKKYVEDGHAIGELPIPYRSGHIFNGWWTSASGGTQIDEYTIITSSITYYAHWVQTVDVAEMDGVYYATLQAAINAAGTNPQSQKVITLRSNIGELLSVAAGQDIKLDLNGYTLINSGSSPVLTNAGDLEIVNGNILSSAAQGAINNTAGSLIIGNGTTINNSGRQAIYITGGTVEITGDAYLTSQAEGKPTGSNMERATVQVVSGTLYITGGTIIGEKTQAVSNEGTVIIGVDDGVVSTTSPVLMGALRGIKSTGSVYFYDGILKGKTNAIDGAITGTDSNSIVTSGTEIINGQTYYTATLQ